METYGRLDILVNNAAGLGQGTILTTTEEQFDYMTIAKMKGAYNTCLLYTSPSPRDS